jgi:hypothetical protein
MNHEMYQLQNSHRIQLPLWAREFPYAFRHLHDVDH